MLLTSSGAADISECCLTTDWSQLGDFEMTTPLADLLQEISDKGIPTSVDEVSNLFYSPCLSLPLFSVPYAHFSLHLVSENTLPVSPPLLLPHAVYYLAYKTLLPQL